MTDRQLPWQRADTLVVDLDGVLWSGHRTFESAVEFVKDAIVGGKTVCFATNNGFDAKSEIERRLASLGFEDHELITAAEATADLLPRSCTVWCLGGLGLSQALARRGVEVTDNPFAAIDCCVVGYVYELVHSQLHAAAVAASRAGRLLGVSDDPLHIGPEGPCLGGGALVTAIGYAAGVRPQFCGKPHPPMVERVGRWIDGRSSAVLGDSDAHDGALAHALGVPFVRVTEGHIAGAA